MPYVTLETSKHDGSSNTAYVDPNLLAEFGDALRVERPVQTLRAKKLSESAKSGAHSDYYTQQLARNDYSQAAPESSLEQRIAQLEAANAELTAKLERTEIGLAVNENGELAEEATLASQQALGGQVAADQAIDFGTHLRNITDILEMEIARDPAKLEVFIESQQKQALYEFAREAAMDEEVDRVAAERAAVALRQQMELDELRQQQEEQELEAEYDKPKDLMGVVVAIGRKWLGVDAADRATQRVLGGNDREEVTRDGQMQSADIDPMALSGPSIDDPAARQALFEIERQKAADREQAQGFARSLV